MNCADQQSVRPDSYGDSVPYQGSMPYQSGGLYPVMGSTRAVSPTRMAGFTRVASPTRMAGSTRVADPTWDTLRPMSPSPR